MAGKNEKVTTFCNSSVALFEKMMCSPPSMTATSVDRPRMNSTESEAMDNGIICQLGAIQADQRPLRKAFMLMSFIKIHESLKETNIIIISTVKPCPHSIPRGFGKVQKRTSASKKFTSSCSLISLNLCGKGTPSLGVGPPFASRVPTTTPLSSYLLHVPFFRKYSVQSFPETGG